MMRKEVACVCAGNHPGNKTGALEAKGQASAGTFDRIRSILMDFLWKSAISVLRTMGPVIQYERSYFEDNTTNQTEEARKQI